MQMAKLKHAARRVLLATIVLAAIAGLWWFWYTHRNYGALFESRAGHMVETERSFVSESNSVRLYDQVVTSNTGLQSAMRISIPADLDGMPVPSAHKVPALLLTAGLHTGKEAVSLIPPRTDMVVMALDYGWTGEFDVSTFSNMKRDLGQLRATTMDAVPRALLALDSLCTDPMVDRDRITVVGVSYGSYVALPAAALHPEVDELILVQGGARIGPTIAGNARLWKTPLPAPVAGWIGAMMFVPFDPVRWARRLEQKRFTMMASRNDEQIPTDALTAVFDASPSPHKEFIWMDAPHVAPDADAIIQLISRNIVEHLDKTHLPSPAP
jgi:dienelactone hydrolase